MEQKLGRYLLPSEQVHHISGVKDDNRPENLELWATPQPAGQRVEDLADWAVEILRRYRPNSLVIFERHCAIVSDARQLKLAS